MFTDYKFWWIKRDNNGFITDVAIRLYEGDYQDKQVEDENGNLVTRSVYVRTKRLETFPDLSHLAKNVNGNNVIKGVTEKSGKFCVFYDKNDFGQIKTDDELRAFLSTEVKKDGLREIINEQK